MIHPTDSIQTIINMENAHTSGAYPKRDIALVRGQGCYVWDVDGNRYLDATSGQGVAALGHSHPTLVDAITRQAQALITCPEIFYNDQRAQWYGAIGQILPTGMSRFFLCNSGAEAIEGALKFSRLTTNRTGIVAVKRSFHGRTMGALSVTWNPKYRKTFSAWQPDVTYITYDDFDNATTAIHDEVAAVVVEAIQGEGGVHVAQADYLQHLRKLCHDSGALLIVDEIQTGLGRTGHWFAFEESGIIPDIITLGKALGGGIPMGAVVWHERLGTMPQGAHGSTFGGNPLAMASSHAVLNELQHINAPQQAKVLGDRIIQSLREQSFQSVREIRGRGLMIGIELRTRVTPILRDLQELGILALPAGKTVLRLLPPLTITNEEIAQLETALYKVLA